MKRVFFVSLLVFASIFNIHAQEPQEIVEQFFKNYQQKDCKTAVQIASATNPWLLKDTSMVIKWEKRLTLISKNKGEYYGYEILEINKTGESFIEYVCFVKHSKAPFKISLVFYKPKDMWQVNGIVIAQTKLKNQSSNRNRR